MRLIRVQHQSSEEDEVALAGASLAVGGSKDYDVLTC